MRRQFWEGKPVKNIAKDFGISYCYCWQVCNFYRLKGEAPPDFRPRSRFYSGRIEAGNQANMAGGSLQGQAVNHLQDQERPLPVCSAATQE
jgi:hypothetical protein